LNPTRKGSKTRLAGREKACRIARIENDNRYHFKRGVTWGTFKAGEVPAEQAAEKRADAVKMADDIHYGAN
jgi:hypothetical protein